MERCALGNWASAGIVCSLVLAIAACSSSGDGTRVDVATGGKSSTGDSTTGGQSGTAATGGTVTVAHTGGATSNSGSVNTGGAAATGGVVATGGAAATGVVATTGGVATTGATGGKTATGGAVSTGGNNSAGGAVITGGNNSTGGKVNTGGATSTGGATGAGGSSATCTAGNSNCFSFFVTSRARLFALAQAFNGSTSGWGGDLQYGTGDGLTGADKICTAIAEASLPGNGKTWRAFLSTTASNAIDRVGNGPWYDRLNRLIANNKTELVATRPGGITNSTILNNLPNEDGTPHHNEETNSQGQQADNHDILTGSDSDGKLCNSSACWNSGMMGGGGTNITNSNCSDWTLGTSKSGYAPRVGHTWPSTTGSSDDWISRLNEDGCAPGYNLIQNSGGTGTGTGTVGGGGGYGAIYCLATSPY